ncbi:MAG: ATP-grasp domain-containing protein [Nitrospiraceae bacterium]|nr:ATP-grasp domain-containing protein [Nitrospiraceae bacterium]
MTKRTLIVGREPAVGRVAERAGAIGVPACTLTADLIGEGEVVRTARDRDVYGILAVSDNAVVPVARAASELGWPNVGAGAAARTRDRLALHEALTAAGVECPAYRAVASLPEAEAAGHELGTPIIVKPLDASGGAGVGRVDNLADLSLAYTRAVRASGRPRILIESALEGEELIVDGVVRDSVFTACGAIGCAPAAPWSCVVAGVVAPPLVSLGAVERAIDAAAQACGALGVQNGSVHVEVIYAQETAHVIEVAAYPSTCRFPRGLIEAVWGIDTLANALRMARDEAPVVARTRERGAALLWLSTGSGTVTDIRGEDAARAIRGVEEVVVAARLGDVMGHVVDCPTRDRVGYVMASAETAAEAVEAAQQARNRCEIVTRVAVE